MALTTARRRIVTVPWKSRWSWMFNVRSTWIFLLSSEWANNPARRSFNWVAQLKESVYGKKKQKKQKHRVQSSQQFLLFHVSILSKLCRGENFFLLFFFFPYCFLSIGKCTNLHRDIVFMRYRSFICIQLYVLFIEWFEFYSLLVALARTNSVRSHWQRFPCS